LIKNEISEIQFGLRNVEHGESCITATKTGCQSVNVFFWYQLTWVIVDKGPLNSLKHWSQ